MSAEKQAKNHNRSKDFDFNKFWFQNVSFIGYAGRCEKLNLKIATKNVPS